MKLPTTGTARQLTKHQQDTLVAWLFPIPAFIVYTGLMIVPILCSVYLAMVNWDGASRMAFIGLGNFQALLKSRDFWISFQNSMIMTGLHLIIQIPCALFLAYMLYRTRQGMRFFRSVFFMPTVIAATVVGIMFTLMLNADLGPINSILKRIGLGQYALPWLSNASTVLYVVTGVQIWQYVGYHVVILLAGMQSISEDVIESATIDGASTVRIFFSMVLPLIKDLLQVSLILCVTGCLKAFDHSYIMTWGGPGNASTYLAVYMFKQAFLYSRLGRGTAIGLVILLLAFLFTRIINWTFYHKDKESIT
jgi:raffinose/stachyose/melibiose transport system permease protein